MKGNTNRRLAWLNSCIVIKITANLPGSAVIFMPISCCQLHIPMQTLSHLNLGLQSSLQVSAYQQEPFSFVYFPCIDLLPRCKSGSSRNYIPAKTNRLPLWYCHLKVYHIYQNAATRKISIRFRPLSNNIPKNCKFP